METTLRTYTHTRTPSELLRKQKAYRETIEKIVNEGDYSRSESALALPRDKREQSRVEKKVAHLEGASLIVLVGIGGSSKGVEAVYGALRGTTTKKLLIIDALAPDRIEEFRSRIGKRVPLESLAVFVISKSGATSETLVNASRIIGIGTEVYGETFLSRVVCIGNEGTDFMRTAKKKRMVCVSMPDTIGGRYSIFTSVGIAPLRVLGIDTGAFLAGAASFIGSPMQSGVDARAAYVAQAAREGSLHTLNFFTFEEGLAGLGGWYRQLLAESIGKPVTTSKRPFTHQILPVVSTGIDLHSTLQLYLGGYRGMFTHFVHANHDERTPLGSQWILEHVPELKGHATEEVHAAIAQGVVASYEDAKLPVSVTTFSGLTPYELGQFMASSMYEVMMLAHLLSVNAFDQPQVELYKKHTKSFLMSEN